MIFALDERIKDANADVYYTALGFAGSYPATVILNPDGRIEKIFPSQLHYDDLKREIDNILDLYS